MPESQKYGGGNGGGDTPNRPTATGRSAIEKMRECGMDVESPELTAVDFMNAGLPMVVACVQCETTMVFPSAILVRNPEGGELVYCRNCADTLAEEAVNILDRRPTLYFVSEYSVDRRYGGPEEGGWWYDWWDFVTVREVFRDHQPDANAHRDALQAAQNQRDAESGERNRFSVIGTPDTVYVTEEQPGSMQSTERPHYE